MLFTAFRPAVTLAPASTARRTAVAQNDNHHDNHAQADADPRNDANPIERPVGSRAMLEEGSRLLSSGTLTEGRETELEDSSGSEGVSDEDSSSSSSSGSSREVVGRRF